MDNKDLYKKAMDEIHASEELKRKTLNKIKNSTPKFQYIKLAAACAMFLFVATVGIYFVPENINSNKLNEDLYALDNFENQELENPVVSKQLQTFKDIDELKNVLKENTKTSRDITKDIFTISSANLESVEQSEAEDAKSNSVNDYSTTNVQVQGVDEADIVKTDGKNIYYISFNVLHVVEADSLNEIARVAYDDINLNENFNPSEMYLTKDRLVVVGNYYSFNTSETKRSNSIEDIAYVSASNNFAQAIIYDISSPKSIKEVRKLKIDGSYTNSRMIGNCLYFISSKTPYYYADIADEEILPSYTDSMEESIKYIPANRIVYFPETKNYSYVLIAGVDVSKNEEVNIESFFGAWTNMIYASLENLYIPISHHDYRSDTVTNEIYKFRLMDSKIYFVAKGNVEGYLDSQFSIDEYNGFLRIATTSGYNKDSTNILYILDENLKEVSKLTDIAKGEKIYSVRFMGKVGYIVTFEQIDPLFVVDLSNPYNPRIKGELEMPGYSSYLHPYDETHIIGIGYNVKSNGYGGVTNTNMKMAMFDVSDLSNPKEMFSVNIGDEYVYSELNNTHKVLFYSKEKNLIGFPIQTWNSNYGRSKTNFTIYNIDLEEGFTVHGKIENIQDYRIDVKRAIYINEDLYTLSSDYIAKYNLDTFEKISEINLEK